MCAWRPSLPDGISTSSLKRRNARRQKEFVERSELFMEALNVDEMVGQVLASEGFTSVEEVAYVEPDEIASIDGFDSDTAEEIQARATEYLERIEAELDNRRIELGVQDELREIPGITTAMLVALGEDGVRDIEEFAGYAVDDLVGCEGAQGWRDEILRGRPVLAWSPRAPKPSR